MANTNNQWQPLIGNAKKTSTSNLKLFSVILLISVAIIATFSVSVLRINSLQTASLRSHLCNKAYDKPTCLSHLSEVVAKTNAASDADILGEVLARSSSEIREAAGFIDNVVARMNGAGALADCSELMDLSMDRVRDSKTALETGHYSDAHSWLSSVLTNHVTCLDGLTGIDRLAKRLVADSELLVNLHLEPMLKKLISKASSCLAMVSAIASSSGEDRRDEFPAWITRKDRRLLQVSGQNIVADAVVAADGSGNYTTIQAAVDAAPKNPIARYVIYVKAGVYKEQVSIAKKKNLMLVGDGMDCTIITGSLNVVDGSTTFKSATVAATGDGFIAQDLTIQNTAGPEKHQAVALRIGADKSVINRCKLDAYQDTLYTHSLRQFYRDCYITGTVDFIFGDGAVVVQSSQIVLRLPMHGQNNMLTAQGRTDPNSNTGYSIQFCNITASPDLIESGSGPVKTYLGRPWKMYSRTVFMESVIGAVVDPAGWSIWTGDFALETLYYGEYLNSGPGAGTAGRVNWTGYHGGMSRDEAAKFTVAAFIYGGDWLGNTGVTFSEGL